MVSKKENRYETDEVDFTLFVDTCKLWVARFGLIDWAISYTHLEDVKSRNQAWVNRAYPARSAAVVLNKDWGETEPTAEEIKNVACEEILHILLYPLVNHETTEEEIFQEHGIIYRLINYFNT